MVHPVLRDETNAMAATRTPEKYPEVSENCPSGIRKVHPKIGYLHVTDYTIPQVLDLSEELADRAAPEGGRPSEIDGLAQAWADGGGEEEE